MTYKLISLLTAFIALSSCYSFPNSSFPIGKKINVFEQAQPSFVLIHTNVYRKICDKKGQCLFLGVGGIQGSGTIIEKRGNSSFVLTVAHVCKAPSLSLEKYSFTNSITTISGEKFIAKTIKLDEENDLCLLKVENLTKLPIVKISETSPRLGITVYSISAPLGFFRPYIVPMIKGTYYGRNKKYNYFYLHTRSGGSGGMLLNPHGELVGIISKKHREMDVIIGPTLRHIREFLEKS